MENTNQLAPRPRPKPRTKATTQVNPRPPTVKEVPLNTQTIAQAVVIQDEDELFMRNRKRTSNTWQQLREMDKRTKVVEPIPEANEDHTPRKHKKKRPNEYDLPRWQRDEKFVRMLSEELSDNSDSDIVEVKEATKTRSPVKKLKGKERSRSRSITPPPTIPIYEIQMARNLVRQALNPPPRAPSPVFLEADESTDTIILNPELASIAKSVALQPQSDATYKPQPLLGEQDTVLLSVKWLPHPQDLSASKEIWVFKMNRDDAFRDLFEATAEEAAILVQNLVMTYQGKRIFSSASPRTLNIWTEAELVACDKATYACSQAKNLVRADSVVSSGEPTSASNAQDTPAPDLVAQSGSSINETIEINDEDDDIPSQPYLHAPPPHTQTQTQSLTQNQVHESDAESEADSDKFKIVLQSSLTQGKHISLTVRPTTKCGAILKAFLKKAGLADRYPEVFENTVAKTNTSKKRGRKRQSAAPQKEPRICVDGVRMSNDTEIGDAELEDGDMVEVAGL
ncbi:hypothetical protein AX17_006302 [Amanita inopinata Kibby_2008]|nr:hypothetical protein AX17_006302 [Amanita inopinata Kibby_2008]